MDIREDENLFSGEAEELVSEDVTAEEKPVSKEDSIIGSQDKPSPGTRIIYQAPERGSKRAYTGFSVEEYSSDSPVAEEKSSYTGGHDFEEKMKSSNSYPKKRPAPPVKKEKSEEEEREILRQRYLEHERKKRAAMTEDVILDEIDSLDVEEISIDRSSTAKKKPGKGEIIRRCILAVAIVAIIVSSGVLLNQYVEHQKNEELLSNLNELIITEPTEPQKEDKDDKDESDTATTTRPLTVEEQWAKLKSEHPDVFFPAGIQLKYAKFYAINQDFVGYLSIDELGIGLPVLQSDEEEYYLRRNIYGEKSKYGTLFVPKENDMVNLDRNTVIYGHNMSDGSMFAPLNKYKTVDGFKKAPVIQFDTVYGSYKWKVIAAFITNASAKQDKGYVFPYNFTKLESGEDFMDYISHLKERSLYDTGVDVISGDKILTLSTCTYDFDDARFVVVARLVRDGESEEVDTSQVKVNEKPRYPNEYYKKKDKKNPYKNAEKWYYYGGT